MHKLYACRKSFGPNFVWEDSAKYNTVNSDTMGRILFINNKCGFATDYLHYHSLLEFHAFVATRAAKDMYQKVSGYRIPTNPVSSESIMPPGSCTG